jgi:polysaccharide biosynthesis protein PslJ
LGIALWVMPDGPEAQILARLGVIGYPTDGIIQYIEQNPELAERAISTSVNPNSLGGLLVMVAALATPQIITRYPITGKHWHMVLALLVLVTCLILTFSRGSMIAFGVALFFIGAMRYRRILLIPLVLAAILLVLPWSQAYIERFIAGFQGEDLATQMRFGEYTDAIRLITRYPLFGAGFLGAPDIDIYLGVSSVFLLIAENMGLLGLATFIALMISIFIYAWRARQHLDSVPELNPIWLGLLAALLGALVNGVVDHYFFNLEFHHAILIFWIFVGMMLATARVLRVKSESPINKKPTV